MYKKRSRRNRTNPPEPGDTTSADNVEETASAAEPKTSDVLPAEESSVVGAAAPRSVTGAKSESSSRNLSVRSYAPSSGSRTSVSRGTRAYAEHLAAELKAQQKIADLEDRERLRQLEQKKSLINLELEVEQAQIAVSSGERLAQDLRTTAAGDVFQSVRTLADDEVQDDTTPQDKVSDWLRDLPGRLSMVDAATQTANSEDVHSVPLSRFQELEADVAVLRHEKAQWKQTLSEAHEQLQVADRERTTHMQECKRLLDNQHRECARLQSQLSSLAEELEKSEYRRQLLTQQLQDCSAQCEAQRQKMGELEQMHDQYTQSTQCEYDVLRERNGNLECQVNELETELAWVRAELADSRESLSACHVKPPSVRTNAEEKETTAEVQPEIKPLLIPSDSVPAAVSQPMVEPVGVETIVTSAVTQLARELTSAIRHSTDSGTASSGAQQSGSDLQRFVARQSVVKDLPKFSGDPAEWPMFIHQYRDSTRECHFTDSENLARLQRSLSGRARDAVQSMLVLPSKVPDVLKTLESRFGRAEFVVETVIERARSLRNVRNDDLESLIDLANAVGNLVTTMKLMNSTGHMSNPQLRRELVQKLPSSQKLLWGEHIAQRSDVDLETLADWLSNRADAASCVRAVTRASSHEGHHTSQPGSSTTRRSQTHTALHATDARHGPSSCGYCDKSSHPLDQCRKMKSLKVSECWAWVRQSQRCFSCLGKDHGTKNCAAKKVCGVDGCTYHHHRLLHRPVPQSTSSNTPTSKAPAAQTQPATVATVQRQSQVMLRVLPVRLYGSKNKHVDTYALLDEGSTVTLIETALADELGATGPIDPLLMRWTGPTTEKDSVSRRVQLSISGDDPDQVFELVNVRTLSSLSLECHSCSPSKLAKRWDHLAHIDVTSMESAQAAPPYWARQLPPDSLSGGN